MINSNDIFLILFHAFSELESVAILVRNKAIKWHCYDGNVVKFNHLDHQSLKQQTANIANRSRWSAPAKLIIIIEHLTIFILFIYEFENIVHWMRSSNIQRQVSHFWQLYSDSVARNSTINIRNQFFSASFFSFLRAKSLNQLHPVE